MEFYVAKLNVEPEVLDSYEEKYLIEFVIPSSLNELFKRCYHKDNIIGYQKIDNIKEVLESDLYRQLLKHKESLIEEFNKVVESYNLTKEIRYSEDYMKQRSELKQMIEELFFTYPFLRNSEKTRIISFSKGKTPEIRMGVTYIDRVDKIEKFLRSYNGENKNLIFYYDSSKEWIYIPSNIMSHEDEFSKLEMVVNEIQDEINGYSQETKIGNVSINLIYENFSIKPGNYNEITIERVYPNGSPARDRGRALKAAREVTNYTSSTNEFFTDKEIEHETREDAEKGYITSIRSRTKNIIVNTIRKVTQFSSED